MNKVTKSVLLPYSAHEMYALVTDVAAYPQFLPWCARAEVLDQSEVGMQARLHLAYAGLRMAFTTRNLQTPDREVLVRLVDGPFSRLEGRWGFTPIGEGATVGAGAGACRVDFQLGYEFSSWALKTVLSPVFDRVANTFVDAFVQRAAQVHGPR